MSDSGHGHEDIQCMTYDIHVNIFTWMCMSWYAITCAFRRRVALVGKFFYWPLVSLSWDPLSGTGGVQEDCAPTKP